MRPRPGLSELPVVERDAEREALARLMHATSLGSGSVVVVEGVAGIGKSCVLGLAAAEADRAGVAVRVARCRELERDFTFGAVHQLLDPVVRAADAALRERLFAASAGLSEGLLRGEASAPPPGPIDSAFAVSYGLYWFLVNLCDEGPQALIVDDLHWADEASQRFLAFLAARLGGIPLSLVLSTRLGPEAPTATLLELDRLPDTIVLRPAALSTAGVSTLARDVLDTDVDVPFVDACVAATGGVPFYARELLVELARDGTDPMASRAERISVIRPESVVRSVVARIARTPGPAMPVARALAVLEHASSSSLLADLAGTTLAEARSAAASLAKTGVLAADGLAFVHPIVGGAVYADIPARHRADLHARAARLLQRAGEPIEHVAAHFLRTAPEDNPAVVEVLRAAARAALGSGGAADAVALLERAMSEPPPVHERATVNFELGSALLAAGRPEALVRLQAAFDDGRDQPWWPATALALARALTFSGQPEAGARVLQNAAEAVEDSNPETSMRLWVDWLFYANLSLDLVASARNREPDLRARMGEAATPAARLLLGTVALVGAHANEPAAVVAAQARRAWGTGDLFAVEPPGSPHHWAPIHALILGGDLDGAERAVSVFLVEARRHGSPTAFAMARLLRTLLGLRRGTLAEAEADGLEAVELTSHHFPMALPGAVGLTVEVLVERGALERADEVLAAHDIPPEIVAPGLHDQYLVSRALLRMAQHRWQEALDDLLASGRRMSAWQAPGPAVVPWRSRAALAAARLGDTEMATRLAAEEVALAEVYGDPHPLGVALRAASLVADRDARRELLRRAVAALDGTPFELEAARTSTDLGAALRRTGTVAEARSHLRRGLDLAVRCGATPIAERARQELIASGARPRRSAVTGVDALTATERRVCLLAADSRSNRDIAQELFVNLKTVEVHLTSSYRKLGISSRTELRRALDSST